jgi:hypothetical protein
MKKFILTLLIVSGFITSNAQVLISNDFTGYNGLPSTVAPGWYYSWNDSSSASRSFYNSASSCGVTCPAYKFGHDTVTIITPAFGNADSVQFYLKGNGTIEVDNNFTILESPDSSKWTVVADIDSISASATTYTFPLSSTTTHLMFVYHKDSLGYNVGLDDIYVFQGALNIGINETSKEGISIYPNPTNGPVNIQLNNNIHRNVSVIVTNILGKVVANYSFAELTSRRTIDLSEFEEGIYMVRYKSDKTELLQRILLKK